MITKPVGQSSAGRSQWTPPHPPHSQLPSLPKLPPPLPHSPRIELIEATIDEQEPIILAVHGSPGSGKSRLVGTAPGDIGLLAMEHKSKQTVISIAREQGKRVIMPSINLNRTSNQLQLGRLPQSCIVVGSAEYKNHTPGQIQDVMQRMSDKITVDSDPPICCQRHYYRWHVERVKYCAYQMLAEPGIRTVAIDPFGTFVDDVSYANYGVTGVIDPKEFGFAPREDMIKEIRAFLNNMSTKNLILTHHSKEVWKDNRPTGKMQVDGKFSKLGHHATVMLELRRDEKKLPGGVQVEWAANVQDCQANASLIGQDVLKGEMITFAALAMLVYPESNIDTWL